MKYYDKTLEIDPSYSLAWYSKGYDLNRQKKHEEALIYLDKAIESDNEYTDAIDSKGYSLTCLAD